MSKQTVHNEYIGETYHYKTLDSGLTVYVYPKKDFLKKYAFFTVSYGSNHSDFHKEDGTFVQMPAGVAHFLEHQIFEDSSGNTFTKFEEIGASVNAYTSHHNTVYHFESSDHFNKGLKYLMELVQSVDITEASVTKEKGVIEQEINMYVDEPYWLINQNLMEGLFSKHPMKTDIAGTVESINQITVDHVIECYESFYSPGNMNFFIYGDVDEEEMFDLIDSLQTEDYKNRIKPPVPLIPSEPAEIVTSYIHAQMPVYIGRFELGYKAVKPIPMDIYKYIAGLKVAVDLAFGRSSKLFQEAFNKKMIQVEFDYDIQVSEELSYALISGETDQIDEIVEMIKTQVDEIKANGFNVEEFERKKRMMLGRVISSFNSLQTISGNFTYQKSKGRDYFKQIEAYKSVTLEDVQTSFDYFFDNAYTCMSSLTNLTEEVLESKNE